MQDPETEVGVESESESSEGSVTDERANLLNAQPELTSTSDSYPNAEEWLLKWGSLLCMVLQNSLLFVLTRFTRNPSLRGRVYLSSVAVLFVEFIKLVACLGLVLCANGGPAGLLSTLRNEVLRDAVTTLKLAVPATCYTLQNNLLFVAISNLSAAAAQVLYQAKTLSTALFSVLLLRKSFSAAQWVSFVLLGAGVVLVKQQDGHSAAAPTGADPAFGAFAALASAALSGFAGVYLEKMFTAGSSSLWVRNIQLCMYTIPLQVATVHINDGAAIRRHGLMQGFYPSTWMVVAVQVAGGLLTAIVIKHAGNILKNFANVIAMISTCVISMGIFDFTPTLLFGLGVVSVISSIWLYSLKNTACELTARPRTRSTELD